MSETLKKETKDPKEQIKKCSCIDCKNKVKCKDRDTHKTG